MPYDQFVADGTVEMEIKSMTEPDNILPENKSIFLSITSKKDTDVSLQYTYDTWTICLTETW